MSRGRVTTSDRTTKAFVVSMSAARKRRQDVHGRPGRQPHRAVPHRDAFDEKAAPRQDPSHLGPELPLQPAKEIRQTRGFDSRT